MHAVPQNRRESGHTEGVSRYICTMEERSDRVKHEIAQTRKEDIVLIAREVRVVSSDIGVCTWHRQCSAHARYDASGMRAVQKMTNTER